MDFWTEVDSSYRILAASQRLAEDRPCLSTTTRAGEQVYAAATTTEQRRRTFDQLPVTAPICAAALDDSWHVDTSHPAAMSHHSAAYGE